MDQKNCHHTHPWGAYSFEVIRSLPAAYAWVLNKSVLAAGTRDPLLAARLAGERKQMDCMASGLAKRIFTLAWLTVPPIGFAELSSTTCSRRPSPS